MNAPELEQGQWLAKPDVMLPGTLGRDFTFVTDGTTSRVRRRPKYGDEAPESVTWPPSKEEGPWLQRLPVSLAKGQTLVADDARMFIKQKPAFEPARAIKDDPIDFAPCINVAISGVTFDPAFSQTNFFGNLYYGDVAPGTVITFSPVVTGTTPITYSWKVNGVVVSTSAVFAWTTQLYDFNPNGFNVGDDMNFAAILQLTINNGCPSSAETPSDPDNNLNFFHKVF